MKKLVAVLAGLAVVNVTFAADGPINLTNYDSNNPIMYNPTGIGAAVNLPVADSFVQVLGGPVGGSPVVLSSSAPGSPSTFPLSEPGFFDGGFGFVPGVAESAQGTFQVRAWRNALTYDVAIEKGISNPYTQAVGTAPTGNPPPAPSPAANQMPGFTVTGIPEPSTMILGLLGATVLLFRRRRQ